MFFLRFGGVKGHRELGEIVHLSPDCSGNSQCILKYYGEAG